MATKNVNGNGLLLRGKTWHMRFKIGGHLVAESTHTTVKREAERILATRKAEVLQDVVVDGKRSVSLHTAMDEYISSRHSEKTQNTVRYNLERFRVLPDKSLKTVARHELNKIVETLREEGQALGTIDLKVRYWNSFANFCEEQKYHMPPKLSYIKGVGKRTRWLTHEEQVKLLKALEVPDMYRGKCEQMDAWKQDNYDLIVMLLDTGMRFMEAASMHWNQVDFDKGHIYVRRLKGGKDTVLSMTDRLRDVLVRRRALHETLVFETKDGINRSSTWMKNATVRAGLSTAQGKVTPHVCRHTFAVTMIQNGLLLNEVQHLLGHSSIMMTLRYAHFVKQDASTKAADVMNKLNALQAAKPVQGSNVVALAA